MLSMQPVGFSLHFLGDGRAMHGAGALWCLLGSCGSYNHAGTEAKDVVLQPQ